MQIKPDMIVKCIFNVTETQNLILSTIYIFWNDTIAQ